MIVMYDAMGIRRHAGLQAEILNVVAEEVLEGHPLSERKLKEVLGHTPRQVGCAPCCRGAAEAGAGAPTRLFGGARQAGMPAGREGRGCKRCVARPHVPARPPMPQVYAGLVLGILVGLVLPVF